MGTFGNGRRRARRGHFEAPLFGVGLGAP
jgi:hypothetical protein